MGGEVFIPQINSYRLPTVLECLSELSGKPISTTVTGLRPGEKLHEDMLCVTELPFAYKVKDLNLLQIRPQYTHKTYQQWDKYDGPEFNSALHVSDDSAQLLPLIKRGLTQ